jgi:DNA-directed RNA polymerase specialized sigma24 family protein
MDRELISRARAGDREAFELIVVTKGEPLFRTALAILGNEADARDATQEAFIASWGKFSGLREVDRFDAWLGRILINECRMTLRKRRRVREVAVEETPDLPDRPTGQPAPDSTDVDEAFGVLRRSRPETPGRHISNLGWLLLPHDGQLSRRRRLWRRELDSHQGALAPQATMRSTLSAD